MFFESVAVCCWPLRSLRSGVAGLGKLMSQCAPEASPCVVADSTLWLLNALSALIRRYPSIAEAITKPSPALAAGKLALAAPSKRGRSQPEPPQEPQLPPLPGCVQRRPSSFLLPAVSKFQCALENTCAMLTHVTVVFMQVALPRDLGLLSRVHVRSLPGERGQSTALEFVPRFRSRSLALHSTRTTDGLVRIFVPLW